MLLRSLLRLLFIHALCASGVSSGFFLAGTGEPLVGLLIALAGALTLAGLPRPLRLFYGYLAPLGGVVLGMLVTLGGTTLAGFALTLLSAGALMLRPAAHAPRRVLR